jgi:hypothetical protein
MPKLDRSYTMNHDVQSEFRVAFDCSEDAAQWPWLALPAQHPLVIQTQNFWTSVGATQAIGSRDDDKWSALTWTDWELGDRKAGMAQRGVFERKGKEGEMAFTTTLYDKLDRKIVTIGGKGVIFKNRNFEDWREGSKSVASKAKLPQGDFVYATQKQLGLSRLEPPLLGPLAQNNETLATQALITKSNGLMPGHPFFSGSGDHVNAPHLAEIGRQTASLLNASLLREGAQLEITSGEMDMHRYIELDTPFAVVLEEHTDVMAKLRVRQLEKSCAVIIMRWRLI